MKIKSPIVTLIVGVVIAAIVFILSINAEHTAPKPSYGVARVSVVSR